MTVESAYEVDDLGCSKPRVRSWTVGDGGCHKIWLAKKNKVSEEKKA